MRVSISMDDELVKRIDEVADIMYTSRSGFVSMACTQLLNAQEMLLAVKDMALTMRKIADKGEIDADTQSELDNYVKLCESFTRTVGR